MYYSKTTGGFYDDEIHADIPADAVEISSEDHLALLSGQAAGKQIVGDNDGRPILVDPPPPTAQEITKRLTTAVQAHLDVIAQTMGYDNIFTAVTYAEEPAVPEFQSEGRALRAWRSQVWATCAAVMAEVQDGKRAIPTAEELVAELPIFSMN